jgi:hypothetical protein
MFNVNTSIVLMASLTAAKRTMALVAWPKASPNAAPGPGSTESWPMNCPFIVNSTSWLGSGGGVAGGGFTASPLEVTRCPFGAKASASGPRR